MTKLSQKILTERLNQILEKLSSNLMIISEGHFENGVTDIGDALFEVALDTGRRFHRMQPTTRRWRQEYFEDNLELLKAIIADEKAERYRPMIVFMPVLNQLELPYVRELLEIQQSKDNFVKIVVLVDGDWILADSENRTLWERFIRVDAEELAEIQF